MGMYRLRRKSSFLLGAGTLAVFMLPSASPAQEVDNRPIYYLMVKSLEDGFQAYTAALAEELRAREALLSTRYQSERAGILDELKSLDEERARRETAFNSERESLNRRIEAINERIVARDGRLHEQRRIEKQHAPRFANDPRIKTLKDAIAMQLVKLETIRKHYVEQLAATEKARDALTRQFDEYMSAGDPLALEIGALDEDWQRFAEEERRELKRLADAYAVDYAEYEKWLETERGLLEGMRAEIARSLEKDRELRALHAEEDASLRALVDEYNALVKVHNEAGPDDPQRDARALEFNELERRIAELRAVLIDTRDAVVAGHEEISRKNDALNKRYVGFIASKRERDRALAADLVALNASRSSTETAIDARREKVDAQIRALEARISGELGDARANLESLNAGMIEAYGRDHEGLDTALTRVLENDDDGLLYTLAGTPRFDLSRPRIGEIYTATERLAADRRRIDARIAVIEQGGGAAPLSPGEPSAPGALERERAELAAERQQLLEAFATYARQVQTRAGALEEKARRLDVHHAGERAALGELYSARADVTGAEMRAVQSALLAAVKGLPGRAAADGDYRRLLAELEARAGRMGEPADAGLLAPHALMDHVEAGLADMAAPRAGGWQEFATRRITASRNLTGADKATLAAAWLARLATQADFADLADALDESGAVADGRQALERLFLAGVRDHAAVTEQQLAGGGVGFQVSILGRAYQLDSAGSLEPLPSG